MSNSDSCEGDSESNSEECKGAEGGESPVTEAAKKLCALNIHDKAQSLETKGSQNTSQSGRGNYLQGARPKEKVTGFSTQSLESKGSQNTPQRGRRTYRPKVRVKDSSVPDLTKSSEEDKQDTSGRQTSNSVPPSLSKTQSLDLRASQNTSQRGRGHLSARPKKVIVSSLPDLSKQSEGDKRDTSGRKTSKSVSPSPSKNKTPEPKKEVKRRLFPSTYKLKEFENMKMNFEKKTTSLVDFFAKLKEKEKKKGEERKKKQEETKKPSASTSKKKVLKYFMKAIENELGILSIDLDNLNETAYEHINEVNSKVNKAIAETLKTECRMEPPDEKMIRLLGQFRTAVNEFMRSCIDVVHSTLDNPRPKPDSDSSTDPKLPEIFYETLFMSFSKIFFLNPRQQRTTHTSLFGKKVSSRPDLHFEQTFNPSKANTMQRLVMISEVKRDKPKDDIPLKHQSSPQIIKQMIKEQVMGQIGMSLLIENPHSYISPVVAGILCLRSEILFLLLDITKDHVDVIERTSSGSLDGKSANICYTEAFDILKHEGRKAVMNIMFHFASIQTNDFDDLL